MNKQRLLLISIFVVTFLIGVSAIVVSSIISNRNKTAVTATVTATQATSTVPSLSNETLSCTSISTNKSLTVIWTAPTTAVGGSYVVKGQITDYSTQSTPSSFGPVTVSQGYYVFATANGVDTYYATIWIEDSSGNKSAIQTTNQINSSLCTSGNLPIATITGTATVSASATATSAVTTAAATTTTASTPTPTAASLACNSFTITQNGTAIVNNTVAPGSSAVTLTSGITSPSGTPVYTAAQWTSSPASTVTASATGDSAIWTPPSTGTSFTISLAGVTDSAGASLASPCTVSLTLSGSALPNTAGETPTIAMILGGIATILFGWFLVTKKNTY